MKKSSFRNKHTQKMDVIKIPDVLLGDNTDSVNIFFYIRERGPDQIKLKLHYTQNMICFMIRGAKELYDEYEFYRMNDEQIGLVSSGHMLMNERVTLRQDFESLLLFFSNKYLSDFLLKCEITLDNPSRNLAPVITFPKDEYLLNFQRSMKLLEHDFKIRAFRLAKMEELLLYLLEKYPDRTRGFIAAAIVKEQNNSLPQVVQNHKYKNLNTEELAFLCNMSLSTFKRKFSELYQTSPKQYMIAEKMKKAERLLKHQKKPSEIYFELGYENLSSFSTQFKKYFGISPSVYPAQD